MIAETHGDSSSYGAQSNGRKENICVAMTTWRGKSGGRIRMVAGWQQPEGEGI
jgi:hypothetical protein